jgi:hypothetical protein
MPTSASVSSLASVVVTVKVPTTDSLSGFTPEFTAKSASSVTSSVTSSVSPFQLAACKVIVLVLISVPKSHTAMHVETLTPKSAV